MTEYRQNLPQLNNRLFLTDGGIETTIIYHDGIDLPYFAVFDLLKTERGIRTLRAYSAAMPKSPAPMAWGSS